MCDQALDLQGGKAQAFCPHDVGVAMALLSIAASGSGSHSSSYPTEVCIFISMVSCLLWSEAQMVWVVSINRWETRIDICLCFATTDVCPNTRSGSSDARWISV